MMESFNTYWAKVFPNRFRPPPTIYGNDESGSTFIEPKAYLKNPKKFVLFPLNQRLRKPELINRFLRYPITLCCPAVEEKLNKGVCCKCRHYCLSQKAMKHKKHVIEKQNQCLRFHSRNI